VRCKVGDLELGFWLTSRARRVTKVRPEFRFIHAQYDVRVDSASRFAGCTSALSWSRLEDLNSANAFFGELSATGITAALVEHSSLTTAHPTIFSRTFVDKLLLRHCGEDRRISPRVLPNCLLLHKPASAWLGESARKYEQHC